MLLITRNVIITITTITVTCVGVSEVVLIITLAIVMLAEKNHTLHVLFMQHYDVRPQPHY